MKPLLDVLNKKHVSSPPMWLMRQAGRYLPEYREIRKDVSSFLELCYTPKLAAEVTLQPIRRFNFDAAILFSDILVIPDALGIDVTFKEKVGPILDALDGAEGIRKIKRGNVSTHLAPVFETVELVKKELPDETAFIGFAGSPWTVATYMIEGGTSRDHLKSRRWALCHPGSLSIVMEILVEATTEYLLQQIKAGVEVVKLFDSWSGILPEKQFHQFVIQPTKMIVDVIKKQHPEIPIIGFPRGAGSLYQDYIEETGVDAVALDQFTPFSYGKKLQGLCPVQGNLDPLLLLNEPSLFESEVDSILRHYSDEPFIFNLGHGILPNTPVEHVERLLEWVRTWPTRRER